MAPMRAVSVPCNWSAAARACSGVTASIRSATASACKQITLAVEERTKRELARLGQPRAGTHRGADDAFEQQWVAVGTDLGDVLAGVGVWRLEADDHGVVAALATRRVEHQHLRQRGDAGRAPAGHELIGNVMRERAAQTNDADARRARAASPRRRSCRPERTRHLGFARTKCGQLSTGPREAEPSRLVQGEASRLYFRAMITVFMKASPMLSDVTVGSSAIAMWTMRRS